MSLNASESVGIRFLTENTFIYNYSGNYVLIRIKNTRENSDCALTALYITITLQQIRSNYDSRIFKASVSQLFPVSFIEPQKVKHSLHREQKFTKLKQLKGLSQGNYLSSRYP